MPWCRQWLLYVCQDIRLSFEFLQSSEPGEFSDPRKAFANFFRGDGNIIHVAEQFYSLIVIFYSASRYFLPFKFFSNIEEISINSPITSQLAPSCLTLSQKALQRYSGTRIKSKKARSLPIHFSLVFGDRIP